MIDYKPTIFGIITLFLLVVAHNTIASNTTSVPILMTLAIAFILWLLVCSFYCAIIYPRFFTHGSPLAESAIAYLNGLLIGPFGLLFDYNMNKAHKGYFCYILAIIYFVFAIGNIANLIGAF